MLPSADSLNIQVAAAAGMAITYVAELKLYRDQSCARFNSTIQISSACVAAKQILIEVMISA
jgi:hypothetical protein